MQRLTLVSIVAHCSKGPATLPSPAPKMFIVDFFLGHPVYSTKLKCSVGNVKIIFTSMISVNIKVDNLNDHI